MEEQDIKKLETEAFFSFEELDEDLTPNDVKPLFEKLLENENKLSAMGYFCLAEFFGSERLSGDLSTEDKKLEYRLKAAMNGSDDSMYILHNQGLLEHEESLVWLKVLIVLDTQYKGIANEDFSYLYPKMSKDVQVNIDGKAEQLCKHFIDNKIEMFSA